jgi:hypothetical protein|tara:strand:- start:130 stop:591 length:462 start_codon:yes stop_codon:yes gene_type:complete
MKSYFKNIFFLFIAVFLLGFSPAAHAGDGDAVPINEGDLAPFSGTLLTNEAAASLLAEIHTCAERSTSQLEFELESVRAKCELDLSLVSINLESSSQRYQSIIQSQDEQLEYLLKSNTNRGMSREANFIVGVVAGVLITSAAAYSLSSISNSN